MDRENERKEDNCYPSRGSLSPLFFHYSATRRQSTVQSIIDHRADRAQMTNNFAAELLLFIIL